MLMLYTSMIDTPKEKSKFEKIYLEHRQTMYYVAFRILQDAHEAEDAVHQAFLRILPRLRKIDEQDCHKTRAYLVIITENAAIDIYRKRRKLISLEELENLIPSYPSEDAVEKDAILQAIRKLPISYAVVLKLRYAHGHAIEEIAAELDISEENVRQRISRAKKRLQILLEAEGVQL